MQKITKKPTLDNYARDYKEQNFTTLHRSKIYPGAHNSVRAAEEFLRDAASVTKLPLNKLNSPRNSLQSPQQVSASSIKDAMSDSPRGISPTDKRVEYLLKAKK